MACYGCALFGAQETTGDSFAMSFPGPIDTSDPDFELQLALGISYSSQPSDQGTVVDVNGHRLTSSAGGQDDGSAANGALAV